TRWRRAAPRSRSGFPARPCTSRSTPWLSRADTARCGGPPRRRVGPWHAPTGRARGSRTVAGAHGDVGNQHSGVTRKMGHTNACELGDPGDSQDRGSRLVRSGKVDLGCDAPVVIALRVVQDLPGTPQTGLLFDHQQGRTSRVRISVDLTVALEVGVQRLRPGIGVPARAPVEFA